MEDKIKGITWGNVYQKIEDMCLEVDDLISQETVNYVHRQVQTVGDNVKQFCSEFMQDVLLPSSEEKWESQILPPVKVSDTNSSEVSNIPVNGEDSEKKPFKKSREQSKKKVSKKTISANSPFEGPVKSISTNLSSKQSADTGMVERPEVRVKRDPGENCLSTRLVGSEVHHENYDTVIDGPAELSALCSYLVETAENSSDLVDTTSDKLGSIPSSSYIMLDGCYKNKVLDKELVVVEDLKPKNSFGRIDGSTAELARVANLITGLNKGSVQSGDKKLDESCVVVDTSELYPVTHKAEGDDAPKKDVKRNLEGLGLEEPDVVESDHSSESAAATKSYSSAHEFCESEWEII